MTSDPVKFDFMSAFDSLNFSSYRTSKNGVRFGGPSFINDPPGNIAVSEDVNRVVILEVLTIDNVNGFTNSD